MKEHLELLKQITDRLEAMVISNEKLLAESANLVEFSNVKERVYKEDK